MFSICFRHGVMLLFFTPIILFSKGTHISPNRALLCRGSGVLLLNRLGGIDSCNSMSPPFRFGFISIFDIDKERCAKSYFKSPAGALGITFFAPCKSTPSTPTCASHCSENNKNTESNTSPEHLKTSKSLKNIRKIRQNQTLENLQNED